MKPTKRTIFQALALFKGLMTGGFKFLCVSVTLWLCFCLFNHPTGRENKNSFETWLSEFLT
jgi:hypothetical protein